MEGLDMTNKRYIDIEESENLIKELRLAAQDLSNPNVPFWEVIHRVLGKDDVEAETVWRPIFAVMFEETARAGEIGLLLLRETPHDVDANE